jgi:Ca-activated chloride channel family protein
MRLANPQSVNLLWLFLAFILFYLWAFKRRKRAIESFAQRQLLEELILCLDKRKQKIKISLVSLAVLLCLFSLMRPQWGYHWEEIKRKGLDILIAIDTSKSMLAEDVKPNRLERSKLAVKDLIKKLRGDRIGLIAFSGSAFLQCPLTVDYNGFMLSLDNLSVDIIPRGGTSISNAIKEAIKSYEGGLKKYKVLVLITDGEDHEGNPLEAAEEAREEGIKIFCIGIGTKEGELIPITDERGRRVFLKDRNGNVIKTRLDEATLQKIALNTGGSYVRASGAEFGLDLIYEKKLSKMEKRELKARMQKRYEDRFQIPLFLAIMLLLLEPFVSERRTSR